MTGIDCATPLTAVTAPAIKAAGYDFVGRYLVPAKGSLRWKALTKKEAEIICNAGLRLLTVYETTADRPRGGSAYGTVDGKSARQCAEAIGMPHSGVLYFAVDYATKDYDTVEAYMRAAAQQIAPYRLGVYGSYSVVEAMRSRGVTNYLWQCVAWSYRMVSPHYSVYQHTAGASVAGVAVDINDCPNMEAAGMWSYKEDGDIVERYNRIQDMPEWAQADIKALCDSKILRGYGTAVDDDGRPADLNMSEDMIREIIWCKRMVEKGGIV